MNKFYITTTLPYVNAEPHLGFAMEIVEADVLARYNRMLGKDVVFNTGTDEHGLKVYRKSREEGKEIKLYVDENAAKFDRLKNALNLSYTNFIRTTDEHHIKAAQEFWNRCYDSGDIYKKIYHVKYCVGCELEKTDSELNEKGRCPIHPNLEIEIIEEENYFFRFSRYQKRLLEYYEQYPDFVLPSFRFREIKSFVAQGLQDFSISRLKEKMPWGVPVPNNPNQVMYVWFDALINYISTLGWPESAEHEARDMKQREMLHVSSSMFYDYWGTLDSPKAVQIAGKDNLRQQSAMWQAMLMSAGLPQSRHIIIHGFVSSEGQKMSKSLGNVVDPFQIVEIYGTDALRYWICREASMFEDSDFTWEKFKESYNANLANGLGNLVARILKMAVTNKINYPKRTELGPLARVFFRLSLISKKQFEPKLIRAAGKHLKKFDIQKAIDLIWRKIGQLDNYIQKNEPFKVIKTDRLRAEADIKYLASELYDIAEALKPFMPQTSEKILYALNNPKDENIPRLFPRIE